MAQQDAQIIFEVLPNLQDRRIGQHRTEHLKRTIQIDLFRRAAAKHIAFAFMAERHVASFIIVDRETDTDEIGGSRVQAVSFQINGYDARFKSAGDPMIEPVFALYALIFCGVERHVGIRQARSGRLKAGRRIVCANSVAHAFAERIPHPRREGAKAHHFEEVEQLIHVRIGDTHFFKLDLNLHIGFEGHELFGNPR